MQKIVFQSPQKVKGDILGKEKEKLEKEAKQDKYRYTISNQYISSNIWIIPYSEIIITLGRPKCGGTLTNAHAKITL